MQSAAEALSNQLASERNEIANYLKPLSATDFATKADALSTKAGHAPTFLRKYICEGKAQSDCIDVIRSGPRFSPYVDEFYDAYKQQ